VADGLHLCVGQARQPSLAWDVVLAIDPGLSSAGEYITARIYPPSF
jgi:hypothetical protein